MNKIFYVISVLALMLMMSCSDNEAKLVKAFAIDFASKVSKNQVDSVRLLYPDVALIDSFAITFNPDSVVVEKTETPQTYKVKYSNDTDMLLQCSDEGKITIKETRGMAAFASDIMNIAWTTGWITTDLNDKQRQERLSDTGFVDYYNKYAEKKISELIVLKNPSGNLKSLSGDDFPMANEKHVAQIVVMNKSDKEISASAYTLSYETFICLNTPPIIPDGEPEEHTYYSDNKNLQGKPIKPNDAVTFTITDNNVFGGSVFRGMSYKAKLNINYNDPTIKKLYKPTGKEYEEYLTTKK